jgi:uncharacterized protein with GYD domain
MPTYILLSSWTQKGIENVKESPNRLDKAKEEFRALGVEIKEFWLCQGRYDMVVMIEAPDGLTNIERPTRHKRASTCLPPADRMLNGKR